MASDADKMWAEMTGGTSPKPAAKPANPPASTPSPPPASASSDTELFPPRAPEAKPAAQPAAKPGIPAAAIYVAGAVVVAIALVLIVWMLTSKRSTPTAPIAGSNPSQPAPAATAPSRAGMINLNTATAAQLRTLPDIGPAMADKIVDYRTKNGPFRSVDQLDSVSGIGPKTLAKLRPLVYVE